MSVRTVGALEGLRVIDMTRVIAGPYATQTLGDFGAEVIKIERPSEGDDVRRIGPPWMNGADGAPEVGRSTYYQAVNRNKLSLSLNYADPEGGELLRRLIAGADVLVENYRPGTLARHGLGPEAMLALNPRLIYCSVSGFGQDGPYAGRSGYDYLAQAMAGAMSVTGHPDGHPGAGPMRVGVPLADTLAGLQASVGILAALAHRNATGKGQHVDVSLFEAQLAASMNAGSAWLNAAQDLGRTGNDHPSAAPYGVYPVDDGFILIATFNDREFGRLAKALGHPEWGEDPRFARNGDRVANRTALKSAVTEALKGRNRAEWVEVLNAGTVSCGPINTFADLERDPHVAARGDIVTLDHPRHGPVRAFANPVRLSESPASYRRAPPDVGQDTDAVLGRLLDLTPEQIATLRARGIL